MTLCHRSTTSSSDVSESLLDAIHRIDILDSIMHANNHVQKYKGVAAKSAAHTDKSVATTLSVHTSGRLDRSAPSHAQSSAVNDNPEYMKFDYDKYGDDHSDYEDADSFATPEDLIGSYGDSPM